MKAIAFALKHWSQKVTWVQFCAAYSTKDHPLHASSKAEHVMRWAMAATLFHAKPAININLCLCADGKAITCNQQGLLLTKRQVYVVVLLGIHGLPRLIISCTQHQVCVHFCRAVMVNSLPNFMFVVWKTVTELTEVPPGLVRWFR